MYRLSSEADPDTVGGDDGWMGAEPPGYKGRAPVGDSEGLKLITFASRVNFACDFAH